MRALPWGGGPAPAFDFSGGRLCLDFANTLGSRGRPTPSERMPSYAHLLAWAHQAGLIGEHDLARLVAVADARQAEATDVHRRAVELREAIYRIFAAVARGTRPAEPDLAVLNAHLAGALAHARVVLESDQFVWAWAGDPAALDAVLWPVARDAADLLISEQRERVRLCGDRSCAWVFLDTTRNRSRQWCDMKTCGNRAKARRHYARRKGRAAAPAAGSAQGAPV